MQRRRDRAQVKQIKSSDKSHSIMARSRKTFRHELIRRKMEKMSLTEVHRVDEEIGSSATHKKNSNRHRRIIYNNKRLDEREGMKEQSPFALLPCSQTVAYLQWWKMRKKSLIGKYGKRICKADVEIEARKEKKYERSDKMTVMTDVDPLYFTELSGRPVKEKFSLQQYLQDTRTVLKTRLLIGQEKDHYICFEQKFEQELQCLQKIQYRCQRYMSAFEEYLSRDHKKSMDILERAEQEVRLTKDISAKRNELSKQYGQSRLEVYFWEENWRTVKMCQMFLYQVSPIAWRIKHDFHRSESERSVISIGPTDLLSRYKTPSEDVSLEDLIELFERDVADSGPVELYFEDPFDLIRIFRAMETQNLNALIHLESLAAPMAEMTETITMTEARIKREISEIVSKIDALESSIAETEDRTANLEEYANYLLRDIFRDLVCSEQVLYLRVFVEDTYEGCIGPNDANLDSFSMMKWIERNYEELNLQLDSLPRRIIQICEKEGFRQERKIIKEAEDAARKFELMHRLLDTLKRIMQPPARKKRLLIRRSMPILPKTKLLLPSAEPTNEEVQYLTFFTDYCKNNDLEAYRAMFPDDFDLTFERRDNDIRVESQNDVSSNQEQEEEEKEEKIEEKKGALEK